MTLGRTRVQPSPLPTGPGPGVQSPAGKTVAGMREELAAWLGFEGSITREALVAAIVLPRYRQQLEMARGSPEAVRWLLERPPKLPGSAATMAGIHDDETVPNLGLGALVARASASLAAWGGSGFATVDSATRSRRLDACGRCPHLADPPSSGVQRIIKLARPEAKVCGLCGCIVAAKARMASESCPAVDPNDPSRTRWGELVDEHRRASGVTRRPSVEPPSERPATTIEKEEP